MVPDFLEIRDFMVLAGDTAATSQRREADQASGWQTEAGGLNIRGGLVERGYALPFAP